MTPSSKDNESVVQRLKRESKGYNVPNADREEKERAKNLGAWMRVAAKLGGLTEAEEATLNI